MVHIPLLCVFCFQFSDLFKLCSWYKDCFQYLKLQVIGSVLAAIKTAMTSLQVLQAAGNSDFLLYIS